MVKNSSGISQWLCGGCGQVHGWICPYFGHPGKKLTVAELMQVKDRMKADEKAGQWPFKKPEVQAA